MYLIHWISKIPPISTKRTITSHLNSLNQNMTLEIQILASDMHKQGVVVKPVNGIPLDNWITNGNTYMNKR